MKTCKCDIELMKETIKSVTGRKSPWMIDKNGKELFYVDSFGYRGIIPGETEECYYNGAECYLKIMRKLGKYGQRRKTKSSNEDDE